MHLALIRSMILTYPSTDPLKRNKIPTPFFKPPNSHRMVTLTIIHLRSARQNPLPTPHPNDSGNNTDNHNRHRNPNSGASSGSSTETVR